MLRKPALVAVVTLGVALAFAIGARSAAGAGALLVVGSSGPHVAALQRALDRAGYPAGPPMGASPARPSRP